MKKNTEKDTAEDAEFAISLFNSLKNLGYLFPTSVKDVKNFDALYGTTEVITPEFKSPESVNSQINDKIGFSLKMAAFNSNEDNNLGSNFCFETPKKNSKIKKKKK